MKFGKTLLQNEIPEWSKNYLNYKALKKSIKEAAMTLPPTEDATTALYFQLDRELEKVNTFYVYKQSQNDRRLWIVSEKYQQYFGGNGSALQQLQQPVMDFLGLEETAHQDMEQELMSALKETRAQMRKLLWFAEMNAKGFKKILKKLDKKLGIETQNVYWNTKVAVLPFYLHEETRTNIERLTQWISALARAKNEPGDPAIKHGHISPIGTQQPQQPDESFVDIHKLIKCIDENNTDKLKSLITTFKINPSSNQKARYILLERAALKGSTDCLLYLVTTGIGPLDYHDINERNLLHKICIHQRDHPSRLSEVTLEKLLELAPDLPTQIDFAGCRPLHYAAEFDAVDLARVLLKHAIENGYYEDRGFSDASWVDREGHTPLFLAVLHGNYLTLKELVEIGNVTDVDKVIAATSTRRRTSSSGIEAQDLIPDYVLQPHHPSAVAMACKVSNVDLLKLLIDKGASVDMTDEDGESALLIAVRNRFLEGVRTLIDQGHANVNLAEKINGWTPLIIAAMEGSADIVQLLLDNGADTEYRDSNGWSAYEHAIFRGHPEIGRLTRPSTLLETQQTIASPKEHSSKPQISNKALEARSNAGRLYGHKYLTDQKMIIVKLGSNDVRNPLYEYFIRFRDTTIEEQRLSILVSAQGATGELPIIDLPCKNEKHLLDQEPIVLYSSNLEDVILRFDLVETFGSSSASDIIARATVTLVGDHIFTKSGGFKGQESRNSSLRGRKTAPLISAETLDCIGTIGLEYFVVTPFSHPKMTVGDRYTYYKSLDTKIIGHRGSGMNQRASRLQVGENTVLSFITAASLGAEYIEFDVQLTKDLVPVIYHDWTVSETGFDIPINAITVEQFLNLRPSGYIRDYHTGVSEDSDARDTLAPLRGEAESSLSTYDMLKLAQGKRVARSNSMSALPGARVRNLAATSRRLQFTHANKLGKLKGNGPESIQAPFTTLAEALKIPSSAGLNIEVKYPMVDEAEDDELHQFQEINIFVDTILACVYDNAEQDRRIIFSSFHPEICVALNHKQPNYPVFFLTDAGTLPMADARCNSLQGAVRFAKQADLLGIVAASEPILEAPRMVSVIKESGLLLFTYGVLNNIVENAVAQRNYGVDAVIVANSVVAVRKGLRGIRQQRRLSLYSTSD